MFSQYFDRVDPTALYQAVVETLFMTFTTAIFVFIFGIMLGLLLYLTAKDGLLRNNIVYHLTATLVNVVRAIPFLILIILLIPFTRSIMGTMLGPRAALPALIIGASPLYARMVESALREVNKGVIEAARSLGASLSHIIFRVLLPESLPNLIAGITVTTITLIGFTAIAGAIGAKGLGHMAFMEGFQRGNQNVMIWSTLIILLIVFIVQLIGDLIVRIVDKR